MVSFSHDVINQVKNAADAVDVDNVIAKSLQDIQNRKPNIVNSRIRFMTNLSMALRYEKTKGSNPKADQNVSDAIDLIEQLRKREFTMLF